MKPHVLITGAVGYLGSVLCETQRSLDDDIQGLLKANGMLARSPWKNV
ncbi:MAG: hypothetical protein H6Q42_3031 [Deltaproteobacteria bacterium]|jgi:nucleoside-diphosphate-sugar epimerase|nr:hypothetical protein [Deltaproteobacteria bacterium]